jgi:fatty acid/phospholipid biosynthesis enzyme
VDVVVCDGFIGNVALKISEGVAQHIALLLKKALQSTIASKVGYVLSRSAFKEFRKKPSTIPSTAERRCWAFAGLPSSATAAPTPTPSRTPCASPAELARARLNEKIEQELSALPVAVEA